MVAPETPTLDRETSSFEGDQCNPATADDPAHYRSHCDALQRTCQDLGCRGLLCQRLVPFGSALSELALEVGNGLDGICYLVARHQALSRVGRRFPFDPIIL
jgi:hypothetical protein